jgi:hypothetical protein
MWQQITETWTPYTVFLYQETRLISFRPTGNQQEMGWSPVTYTVQDVNSICFGFACITIDSRKVNRDNPLISARGNVWDGAGFWREGCRGYASSANSVTTDKSPHQNSFKTKSQNTETQRKTRYAVRKDRTFITSQAKWPNCNVNRL